VVERSTSVALAPLIVALSDSYSIEFWTGELCKRLQITTFPTVPQADEVYFPARGQ
jgi:hypothetical protein